MRAPDLLHLRSTEKMLALSSASFAFNAPALRPATAQSGVQMAAIDDLKAIAKELGYAA